MAYTDRDWDNTGTKVTKEDFKRIEKGIKANDTAITEQAKQINDCLKKVNRTNVDLNTIYNTGTEGFCIGCTNTPTGIDGHFKDFYAQFQDNGYQEFTTFDQAEKYFRRRVYHKWSDWKQVATTKKDTIFNGDVTSEQTITLSNALTNYNKLMFIVTRKNISNSCSEWVDLKYPEAIETGGKSVDIYGSATHFRIINSTTITIAPPSGITLNRIIGIWE